MTKLVCMQVCMYKSQVCGARTDYEVCDTVQPSHFCRLKESLAQLWDRGQDGDRVVLHKALCKPASMHVCEYVGV